MEEDQNPIALMRSRKFIGLLAIAAVVGLVAAVAAFAFLEVIYLITQGVYDELPEALGFDSTPVWWSLPFLVISAYTVAWAIVRLPGTGGHIPVHGLSTEPVQPIELPGVVLAAFAGIGLGVVLGPEAPLIALGGGLGLLVVRRMARDAPEAAGTLMATSGLFAAISFLFGSPVVASVLLIEAAGLDKRRLTLVLIPGLLAAGIGSLVSTGIGEWTGVSTSDFALVPLQLEDFPRPSFVDFLWTVPLAAAIAFAVHLILSVGRRVDGPALRRPFFVLPTVAVAISLLAIAFDLITGKGPDHVLFSGEAALDPFVASGAGWSVGAILVLLACKGLAYGLALGSFRGGPVFPALFIGAAAGVLASKLPGFDLTPAVAVGMGAATVAVLRLPLSSVVLALVLTSTAGLGASSLIILGVVVSFLVVTALSPPEDDEEAPPEAQAPPQPVPG